MWPKIFGALAAMSLALCLIFPVMLFLDIMTASTCGLGFIFAAVALFLFAATRTTLRRKAK